MSDDIHNIQSIIDDNKTLLSDNVYKDLCDKLNDLYKKQNKTKIYDVHYIYSKIVRTGKTLFQVENYRHEITLPVIGKNDNQLLSCYINHKLKEIHNITSITEYEIEDAEGDKIDNFYTRDDISVISIKEVVDY